VSLESRREWSNVKGKSKGLQLPEGGLSFWEREGTIEGEGLYLASGCRNKSRWCALIKIARKTASGEEGDPLDEKVLKEDRADWPAFGEEGSLYERGQKKQFKKNSLDRQRDVESRRRRSDEFQKLTIARAILESFRKP